MAKTTSTNPRGGTLNLGAQGLNIPIDSDTNTGPITRGNQQSTINVINDLINNPQLTGGGFTEEDVNRKARELAAEMMRSAQDVSATGRVFTPINPVRDKTDTTRDVTKGMFDGDSPSMTKVFTSSIQTSGSKVYYYDVYLDTSSLAMPQYSISYGNRKGSGSVSFGSVDDTATRAIYSQTRLNLLEPGDNVFTNANGVAMEHIYNIIFARDRVAEKIDEGNWQLNLSNLSGSAVLNANHTGSNVKVLNTKFVSLIDDSGEVAASTVGSSGKRYNIVSGSLLNGVYKGVGGNDAPIYYGIVYPGMATMVLDAAKLDTELDFQTVTGSNIAGDNAFKLFTSISGSTHFNTSSYAFTARNVQRVASTYYYIRVNHAEYNFSNNPTFVSGSLGQLAQPTFIGDPKVYITAIGLYNSRNELMAVGKLSQPILKDFTLEPSFKIRLDW